VLAALTDGKMHHLVAATSLFKKTAKTSTPSLVLSGPSRWQTTTLCTMGASDAPSDGDALRWLGRTRQKKEKSA
jgi:hypothetical protein